MLREVSSVIKSFGVQKESILNAIHFLVLFRTAIRPQFPILHNTNLIVV